jgi:hypothetical protein
MLVRSITPFYVGYDLITLGRVLNIDPAAAHIYITQAKCEPFSFDEREAAMKPQVEIAAVVSRPRRKKKNNGSKLPRD